MKLREFRETARLAGNPETSAYSRNASYAKKLCKTVNRDRVYPGEYARYLQAESTWSKVFWGSNCFLN